MAIGGEIVFFKRVTLVDQSHLRGWPRTPAYIGSTNWAQQIIKKLIKLYFNNEDQSWNGSEKMGVDLGKISGEE